MLSKVFLCTTQQSQYKQTLGKIDAHNKLVAFAQHTTPHTTMEHSTVKINLTTQTWLENQDYAVISL